MSKKTTLNYNNEPLKDDEVLVLMPLFEEERKTVKNPDSIVTIKNSRGYVEAVRKAVPKKFEAVAKEQFNDWARGAQPAYHCRCLIPQSDGSKKVCPKKKGNNHPACKECPHRDEYEREMPKHVSLDSIEEKGWAPVYYPSPETILLRAEERREDEELLRKTLYSLIKTSPKHALAFMLMAQNVKGKEFADRLKLGHDSANRVRNQIDHLAPKLIDNLNQFNVDGLKANRSKNDSYYLEEAQKILDSVLKLYSAF